MTCICRTKKVNDVFQLTQVCCAYTSRTQRVPFDLNWHICNGWAREFCNIQWINHSFIYSVFDFLIATQMISFFSLYYKIDTFRGGTEYVKLPMNCLKILPKSTRLIRFDITFQFGYTEMIAMEFFKSSHNLNNSIKSKRIDCQLDNNLFDCKFQWYVNRGCQQSFICWVLRAESFHFPQGNTINCTFILTIQGRKNLILLQCVIAIKKIHWT